MHFFWPSMKPPPRPLKFCEASAEDFETRCASYSPQRE